MSDTTKVKEAEMYQELQNIYLKYNQRKRPLSGQIYETITLIDKYTREARIDELQKALSHTRNVRFVITDNGGGTYSDDTYSYVSKYELQERIAQLTEQKDGE